MAHWFSKLSLTEQEEKMMRVSMASIQMVHTVRKRMQNKIITMDQ